MIARCARRSLDSIPDAVLRAHVSRYVHLSEVNLQIGQCYDIYGVTFFDGIPWFLICEDPGDEYPKPHCSVFFDLVDPRVEAHWVLSMSQTNVGKVSLLPREWASDTGFLEKLMDGDERAVAEFRRLKSLRG